MHLFDSQAVQTILLCWLLAWITTKIFPAKNKPSSDSTTAVAQNQTTAQHKSIENRLVRGPVPAEYAYICEFLNARELAVVQLLSKEWRSAAAQRVQSLLVKQFGEALNDFVNPATTNPPSLSQRLHYLETKDLIPLWADKTLPANQREGGIPCPKLGQLVQQLMRHSNCGDDWENYHSGAKHDFVIQPRPGFEQHPFGSLLFHFWPLPDDSNVLQLSFCKDTTVVNWTFQICDRSWYLTGQGCHMKDEYKICTQWSSRMLTEEELERYKPEFRPKKNERGECILEEASVLWQNIQEHFLEAEYRVNQPHFCSLPSCPVLLAKKRCSRCKLCFYCSVQHQRQHWKDHRKFCFERCPVDDKIELYRNVENVHEHEYTIFEMFRRKGMSLVDEIGRAHV